MTIFGCYSRRAPPFSVYRNCNCCAWTAFGILAASSASILAFTKKLSQHPYPKLPLIVFAQRFAPHYSLSRVLITLADDFFPIHLTIQLLNIRIYMSVGRQSLTLVGHNYIDQCSIRIGFIIVDIWHYWRITIVIKVRTSYQASNCISRAMTLLNCKSIQDEMWPRVKLFWLPFHLSSTFRFTCILCTSIPPRREHYFVLFSLQAYSEYYHNYIL